MEKLIIVSKLRNGKYSAACVGFPALNFFKTPRGARNEARRIAETIYGNVPGWTVRIKDYCEAPMVSWVVKRGL